MNGFSDQQRTKIVIDDNRIIINNIPAEWPYIQWRNNPQDHRALVRLDRYAYPEVIKVLEESERTRRKIEIVIENRDTGEEVFRAPLVGSPDPIDDMNSIYRFAFEKERV